MVSCRLFTGRLYWNYLSIYTFSHILPNQKDSAGEVHHADGVAVTSMRRISQWNCARPPGGWNVSGLRLFLNHCEKCNWILSSHLLPAYGIWEYYRLPCAMIQRRWVFDNPKYIWVTDAYTFVLLSQWMTSKCGSHPPAPPAEPPSRREPRAGSVEPAHPTNNMQFE